VGLKEVLCQWRYGYVDSHSRRGDTFVVFFNRHLKDHVVRPRGVKGERGQWPAFLDSVYHSRRLLSNFCRR